MRYGHVLCKWPESFAMIGSDEQVLWRQFERMLRMTDRLEMSDDETIGKR